jgi:hypothetical protein
MFSYKSMLERVVGQFENDGEGVTRPFYLGLYA